MTRCRSRSNKFLCVLPDNCQCEIATKLKDKNSIQALMEASKTLRILISPCIAIKIRIKDDTDVMLCTP